jgi:hypothetical protein
MIDESNKNFNALVNGLFKGDHAKVQTSIDILIKERVAPILKEKQKEIAKTLFKK